MKYIIIIPDGMADHPVKSLGNKTPLEVARTTNMDYLAQHGMTGLVKTIPDKMPPGSDIGNMAILGYNPEKCHTGRAPLEAASMNVDLKENEIAVRCNLVTVVDGKMADYSAGHIQTKEATLLIDALNKEMNFEGVKFHTGKSYRHLLVLTVRDPGTYLKIKTVPPHDILGKDFKSYLPQGHESEMFLKLMEKSKSIMENHSVNQVRIDLKENPANMIWLWGQGTKPQLPPFEEKFSVKGSMISAVDLVNGIGKLAGLEIITVPGATGYYDTDYKAKAQYALEALKTKDFVCVHVEAPDEAGHNGDIKEKIEAIERIDQDIVGAMLNAYGEQDDVRILVLPDHPTPVELRTHTHEPVGFVMYGKGIDHDGSKVYSEKNTNEKGLKFKNGEEMMDCFMKKYL
ncbi:Predicted functional analog of homoserine kinase [hydrothermal vent metagenome]|uniref:Predicted functional analog of homoserine kinase n=1 Tax=hydrothermal vent metagenome TaxID=652676 RepID=A0A3B1E1X1_9ZZZZ